MSRQVSLNQTLIQTGSALFTISLQISEYRRDICTESDSAWQAESERRYILGRGSLGFVVADDIDDVHLNANSPLCPNTLFTHKTESSSDHRVT